MMRKLNIIFILIFLFSGIVYSQSNEAIYLNKNKKKELLVAIEDTTVVTKVVKDSILNQKTIKRKPLVINPDLSKSVKNVPKNKAVLKKKL